MGRRGGRGRVRRQGAPDERDQARITAAASSAGAELRWHAREGNAHAVLALLAANANLEALDVGGRAPLHAAAQRGSAQVAQDLIAAGANVNSEDLEGYRPIHLAASFGHVQVLRALIAADADVDIPSRRGFRPLQFAASDGFLEMAQALIAANADVSSEFSSGRRALHASARNGHEQMVHLLLEEGAAPDAKDAQGGTPLALAESGGHERVAILLREALEARWVNLVPLQLFADVEGGLATISCVSLEGDTLLRLGSGFPKTGGDLVKLVRERVPAKPRTQWKLVLPSAEILEGELLSKPLHELLGSECGEAKEENEGSDVANARAEAAEEKADCREGGELRGRLGR